MRLVAAADDALFQVDAVKNWSTTVLSSGLSVEFYARIERGFGLIVRFFGTRRGIVCFCSNLSRSVIGRDLPLRSDESVRSENLISFKRFKKWNLFIQIENL